MWLRYIDDVFFISTHGPDTLVLFMTEFNNYDPSVCSCKCYGKQWGVSDYVTGTPTFTSKATQNTYKINHQINCRKKCLVYLLTCNKCFKQYIRPTVDKFRWRWNNYKSNDRKFQRLEPCMQVLLFSHFSMAVHNGFLNDVSITFIDKTDPSDPLRREDYWRQALKTMALYGLNTEDSVWWLFLCLLFYMAMSVF